MPTQPHHPAAQDLSDAVQQRFIAAVVKDDTCDKLDTVRNVPAEVFSDYRCARAWRVLRRAVDYNEAVLHADVVPFFGVETTEIEWVNDLKEVKIAYIRQFGSLSRAAEIFPEMGPAAQRERDEELWQSITSRFYDRKEQIPAPENRFLIADKGVCTPGNLTSIVADSGVGKSSFMGAFISALNVAETGAEGCDTLGVTASSPEGRLVIHIDTEQSRYDHQASVDRALKRANCESQPPWLWSACLTGLSRKEQRRALRVMIERAPLPLHSIILDGPGDMVVNLNDPAESDEVVAELHAIAIEQDCPVIGVIHVNPGSETGKARGHFGSSWDRKAESVIHLKRTDDVTQVKSKKSRRAPITDSDGVAFEWSDDLKMHMTTESPAKQKAAQQAETRWQEKVNRVRAIFDGKKELRHSEIIARARLAYPAIKSNTTFENWINDWNGTFIEKELNSYRLITPTPIHPK